VGVSFNTKNDSTLQALQIQQYRKALSQNQQSQPPSALEALQQTSATSNTGKTSASAVQSVTQSSSGSLQRINELIHSIRVLADQATNPSATQEERDALQIEIEGKVKVLIDIISGLNVDEKKAFSQMFTGDNIGTILSIDVPTKVASKNGTELTGDDLGFSLQTVSPDGDRSSKLADILESQPVTNIDIILAESSIQNQTSSDVEANLNRTRESIQAQSFELAQFNEEDNSRVDIIL